MGDDTAGSDQFWTLRIPLTNGTGALGYVNLDRKFNHDGLQFNMSYLTTIFQPALALAVERILTAPAGEAAPRHLTAHAG